MQLLGRHATLDGVVATAQVGVMVEKQAGGWAGRVASTTWLP